MRICARSELCETFKCHSVSLRHEKRISSTCLEQRGIYENDYRYPFLRNTYGLWEADSTILPDWQRERPDTLNSEPLARAESIAIFLSGPTDGTGLFEKWDALLHSKVVLKRLKKCRQCESINLASLVYPSALFFLFSLCPALAGPACLQDIPLHLPPGTTTIFQNRLATKMIHSRYCESRSSIDLRRN